MCFISIIYTISCSFCVSPTSETHLPKSELRVATALQFNSQQGQLYVCTHVEHCGTCVQSFELRTVHADSERPTPRPSQAHPGSQSFPCQYQYLQMECDSSDSDTPDQQQMQQPATASKKFLGATWPQWVRICADDWTATVSTASILAGHPGSLLASLVELEINSQQLEPCVRLDCDAEVAKVRESERNNSAPTASAPTAWWQKHLAPGHAAS